MNMENKMRIKKIDIKNTAEMLDSRVQLCVKVIEKVSKITIQVDFFMPVVIT